MGHHEAADALYRCVFNERKATLGTDCADALRTVSYIYICV